MGVGIRIRKENLTRGTSTSTLRMKKKKAGKSVYYSLAAKRLCRTRRKDYSRKKWKNYGQR